MTKSNLITITCSLCFFLFLLLSSLPSPVVGVVGAQKIAGGQDLTGKSPFTAKASFIRHWKKHVSGELPKPWFLNKTSPLDGVQLAKFINLADQNLLATKLDAFCSEANLLCYPEATSFSQNGDFSGYGASQIGGIDSFKNYPDGDRAPLTKFKDYSRSSISHDDQFDSYALDQEFKSYGQSAIQGSGDFTNYKDIDVAGFTSYSQSSTNGRQQEFKTYADHKNTGSDAFKNYGQSGSDPINDFTRYGTSSSAVTSEFSNYGQSGISAIDTFDTYSSNGNDPLNRFNNYDASGSSANTAFTNYRSSAKSGSEAFESYGQSSSSAKIRFASYDRFAKSGGTTSFSRYGKSASNKKVDFTTYASSNPIFKEYASTKGVTFSNYLHGSFVSDIDIKAGQGSAKKNMSWVEPGKFFREEMLKTGKIIPMPDIQDKMPRRSFLPQKIVAKLPFSNGKIEELQKNFRAKNDSALRGMIINVLSECERAPSPGETKHCVGSAEDMVEFATSVLGRNIAVRTTENTNGSNGDILIGSIKGINGGKVTKSVSCHQSLFPYLLYYCHSVPKVRVYEANILDPKSKEKINQGIAICHIDTSSWSPNHGAFLALGMGPGKIEVCHWIFENDMTWTIAD